MTEDDWAAGTLPTHVRDWLSIVDGNPILTDRGHAATALNDNMQWNFDQIADAIEHTYLYDETV